MLAGVSKSGSPRAKSNTSTPSDFSRLASAAIARVAEGAIRLERSARLRAIAPRSPLYRPPRPAGAVGDWLRAVLFEVQTTKATTRASGPEPSNPDRALRHSDSCPQI